MADTVSGMLTEYQTFYISRYLIEIPMAILSRLILFVLVYWYLSLLTLLRKSGTDTLIRVCAFRPEAGPFFIYMGINCLTVILSVAMG